MGEIWNSIQDETRGLFKNKKNLTSLLLLGILVLALPLLVNIVKRQQIISSRAAGERITFVGENVTQKNGAWVALKPQISLELISPLGQPRSSGSAQSENIYIKAFSEVLVKTAYADAQCPDDVTYCDVASGKSVHKHGGYWDGSQCVYAFDVVGDCGGGPAPAPGCPDDVKYWDNASNVCVWKHGGTWDGSQCVYAFDVVGNDQCGRSTTQSCPDDVKYWDNASNVCVWKHAGVWDGSKCVYAFNTVSADQCGRSAPSPSASARSSASPGASYGPATGFKCVDWSNNCEDKSRVCTTPDGKAGVVCVATCKSCGPGQGACSGSANDPGLGGLQGVCTASGISGPSCNWSVCIPGSTGDPGTNACTLPTSLTADCTNCILKIKNSGGGDLYNTIKAFDRQRFGQCSFEQLVSYWCSGQLSAQAKQECDSIKAGACSVPTPGTALSPASKNCSTGTTTPTTNPSVRPSTTNPTTNPTSPGGPNPTGGGPAPTGGGPNPTTNPTTQPAIITTRFRVAENPAALKNATWQSYSTEPMPVDFEFQDKAPGGKFVYVEFEDSTGATVTHNRQIRLLGGNPAITSCALSFEGNNTIITLKGENFGNDKGTIKSNESSLGTIREWKNNSVKVVWLNAPEGQTLPIKITNVDGQISEEGQCSSISRLALGAKVFCRAPSSHDTANVELVLTGAFEGGTKAKQVVTINREGVIQGLNQRMEDGKSYGLSIKAPRSLRQTVPVTAGEGTTNIPNFILPIGDIFPADGGDGVINTLDKSELNRQWIIAQSASNRSGDFNQDGRVNSIDWACMRYDFGDKDDPEPVAGVLPVSDISNTSTNANASPSPSPSPSYAASSNPSPSVSPSPTPSSASQTTAASPSPSASSANSATTTSTTDEEEVAKFKSKGKSGKTLFQ